MVRGDSGRRSPTSRRRSAAVGAGASQAMNALTWRRWTWWGLSLRRLKERDGVQLQALAVARPRALGEPARGAPLIPGQPGAGVVAEAAANGGGDRPGQLGPSLGGSRASSSVSAMPRAVRVIHS